MSYIEMWKDTQGPLQKVIHFVRIRNSNAIAKIFPEAMKEFCDNEIQPGYEFSSDDHILDFIKNKAETLYHPSGTCKMGFDQNAVVDKNLKVHGIKGLRVADASIMPTLVSGNTNAVCMMIGERCADFIING